jgi:hypothetical protein
MFYTNVSSGSGISTVGQQFDSVVLQPGIYQIHFNNIDADPSEVVFQATYLASLNGTAVAVLGGSGSGGDVLVPVSQINTVFQLAVI